MFLTTTFSSLDSWLLAATPLPDAFDCVYSGICKETSAKIGAFNTGLKDVLDYFLVDPDSLYTLIFSNCQVIAGVGALWFLIPLMLNSMKNDYGLDLTKIFVLFILMLMFAGEGKLGKSLAYGNYAFIQGIHQQIKTTLDASERLQAVRDNFSADQQQVLQIVTQMLTCSEIQPTKTDATNKISANPAFTNCVTALKTSIASSKFDNAATKAAFVSAANEKDFITMAAKINNASGGFSNVDASKEASEIRNLLVGWRGAIAIVPDLALAGALLFYPFALAISFFNTSFLQSWFTGMWSVGLFKYTMTIFNGTFRFIEVAMAGTMPQNTVNLVLGIAAPTIAIALATGSGLGLSSLVSQGVSSLSSKLSSTSSATSNAYNAANPIK